MIARLVLAAVLLFTVPLRADEPNPDRPILDLVKSGKLFDAKEYKTVRAAFAKRFEEKYADAVKIGFGGDDDFAKFLDGQADLKQDFLTAIDEDRDNIPKALALFHELWQAAPDQFVKYGSLATAFALTWDDPRRGVYDYRGHAVRTKAVLADDVMKLSPHPVDHYRHFLKHEKELQLRDAVPRLQGLPREFLVYVVDHFTPDGERDWAIKKYAARRARIGSIYGDVQYDQEMLRTRSQVCKLNGKPYTLESILDHGGVCAMQGDFASRVAKSVAVPAIYVTGEAVNLDLHAWVVWAEINKIDRSGRVDFTLMSHGQYEDLKFYTGSVTDPQTGEKILDRDVERRLGVAGLDRNAKRHAELVMRAYPLADGELGKDAGKRIAFLDKALQVSPYNESAWLELARLARSGGVKNPVQVSVVLGHLKTLLTKFARYPDFTWKVYEDLLSLQPDAVTRAARLKELLNMYELAGRPDLSCEAALKCGDLYLEIKRPKDAAKLLTNTVSRFPAEGRYVPRLVDKLRESAKLYPTGVKDLAELYTQLLPKIPPARMGEVSKYAVAMHEQALQFFTDADNQKALAKVKAAKDAAPAIEQTLRTLKAGARKGSP